MWHMRMRMLKIAMHAAIYQPPSGLHSRMIVINIDKIVMRH